MPIPPARLRRKLKRKRASDEKRSKLEQDSSDFPLTWRIGAKLLEWRYGVNPLNFLSGWKTFIGGIGGVGLAIYQLSQGDYQTAMATFAAAMAVLGIGGKLEKAAEAAKTNGQ